MSISGIKDIDREIFKYLTDEELLQLWAINKKTYYTTCNDDFLKRKLTKYNVCQYKNENETWKRFLSKLVYYLKKLREFNFEYTGGDFYKQYMFLNKFRYIPKIIFSTGEKEIYLLEDVLRSVLNKETLTMVSPVVWEQMDPPRFLSFEFNANIRWHNGASYHCKKW